MVIPHLIPVQMSACIRRLDIDMEVFFLRDQKEKIVEKNYQLVLVDLVVVVVVVVVFIVVVGC